MKYYYTKNNTIYDDEHELDEAIRYELGKEYNGYISDYMVEDEINSYVEEWEEEL